MTITIDVPEAIVHESETRGIPVETLVTERLSLPAIDDLESQGFLRFGPGSKTVAEAVDSLLERRKKYPLGEVTIKQLIEEGRRY